MLPIFDLGTGEEVSRGGDEEEAGGGGALIYGADDGCGGGEMGLEDGLINVDLAREHG